MQIDVPKFTNRGEVPRDFFPQFQETSLCTFKYWNTFENLVSGALKSIEIFVSAEGKKKHQHIIKHSVVWEIL